jgi:S1-C subfamily serine protease
MKATLLLPALLAGAIVAAAAGLAARGDSTRTTTVVAPSGTRPAAAVSPFALTPSQLYRRAAPGVVHVRAGGRATCAGFAVDRRGDVVTAARTLAGGRPVTVSFGADGRGQTRRARVVGRDRDGDVAVLRVDPAGIDLHPLPLGDSAGVAVGDPTYAIGNPLGLDRTLTTGVVSAVRRRAIETDAALSAGSFGGPLLDARGQVIGIALRRQGANRGIGFAVPSNTAKRAVAAALGGSYTIVTRR